MPARRPARFAGSWYPDDPVDLRAMLEAAARAARGAESTTARGPAPLAAALLPHAGLAYSAACQLAGLAGAGAWRDRAARVLILAPSHYYPLDPDQFYTAGLSFLDTPLGGLEGWQPELAGSPWNRHPAAVLREHAVELLLPALAWIVPDARVFPVLAGPVSSPGRLAGLVACLQAVCDQARAEGRPCLVLASSDLTHYGQRFDHVPYGRTEDAELRRKVAGRDLAACALVAGGDGEGLFARQAELAPTMCGRYPAMLLAGLARNAAWTGELAGYYRSDQAEAAPAGSWPGSAPAGQSLGPGRDGFVSYGAVRFTGGGNDGS